MRHPSVMLLSVGRHLRIDFEGAWHHVMHRGAGRRVVFRDDEERRIFLRLLGELEDRFGLEIHAYVLMSNHFHLLVRSADGRLSDAMQWLLSNFTRWANSRREVDGAIFRGRFHGVPVESAEHRYLLFRYLAENPIDLGSQVDPVTYEWSSVSTLSGHGHSRPSWLHTELLEELYGANGVLLVEALRGARGGWEEPASPRLSIENLDHAASQARAASAVAAGLTGSVEREGLRSAVAMWIVDMLRRWTREQIGETFGVSASAVGTSLYRLRQSIDRDPAVRRYAARAAELMSAEAVTLGV